MIESIDIILAALTAGGAAGLTDTASAAIKDSYQGLKKLLVAKALHKDGLDDPERSEHLEKWLADPCEHEDQLRRELLATNSGSDTELLVAARRLLELVDPAGISAGKYQVDVHDSQGVQIGDGNTMSLKFEK